MTDPDLRDGRRARYTLLILSGSIHVFTIRFQPGGFHAFFRVPMTPLFNEKVSVNDVIG